MRSLFVGATLWQGYDKRAVKMELSIKLLARRFRSLALISLQFNDDTFLYEKFSREIFLKFYRITCTQPILICFFWLLPYDFEKHYQRVKDEKEKRNG